MDLEADHRFQFISAAPGEYAEDLQQSIVSHPKEVMDFCHVRHSLDLATSRLIHLLREEVSIDDLDKKRNEQGKIFIELAFRWTRDDTLESQSDWECSELNRSVAIEQAKREGTQFFIDLGLALSMKASKGNKL